MRAPANFTLAVNRQLSLKAPPLLFSQLVVDVGRSDRGMTGRNADLIELVDDIARGVKARDAGALVIVRLDVSELVALGAKRRCKVRANFAAQRGIEHVHFDFPPVLEHS